MTSAIEVTEFTVSSKHSNAFEDAMRTALPILDRQPGVWKRSFGQTLEESGTFYLLVEWQALADHVTLFRNSDDFVTFTSLFRTLLSRPSRVLHIVADHA